MYVETADVVSCVILHACTVLCYTTFIRLNIASIGENCFAAMVIVGGIRRQLGVDKESNKGIKRKVTNAEPTHGSGHSTSASSSGKTPFDFLGNLYGAGRLSSKEVVLGCQAVRSGCDSMSGNLARISTNHSGNIQRDLLRKLAQTSGQSAPDLYVAEAPFWDKVGCKVKMCLLYFLLPFEVLDSIIMPGRVADWCSYRDIHLKSKFQQWQDVTNISDSGNFVAFGIWGDSAPFNTRDSVQLMLFNVLSNESCQKRIWFTAFSKDVQCNCGCKGRHTYDVVWSVMKWCLDVLASGTRPSHRHDGAPLKSSKFPGDANRFQKSKTHKKLRVRGWCAQKRGDWAWLKQALGMTGWGGEGPYLRVC
jgi:hypothetical protein